MNRPPDAQDSTRRTKTRLILLAAAGVATLLLYALRTGTDVTMLIGSSLSVSWAVHSFWAPPRQWQMIVIHHSGTPAGNAATFDKYHRHTKGWEEGLGYHFVIGNGTLSRDGQIEVGHRWRRQLPGAHAGPELNQIAIGICLVGDFENGPPPTEAQMKTLLRLVRTLCHRFNLPYDHVILHRQVPSSKTLCPGRKFPAAEFLAQLANAHRDKETGNKAP